MALQTKINGSLVAGIVGEFSDNSPKTARAYTTLAKGDVLPTFGKLFSFKDQSVVDDSGMTVNVTYAQIGAGSDSTTMGILVNPKEHYIVGFKTGRTIADKTVGTIATRGHIWVLTTTPVVAGAAVAVDANGNLGSANLTGKTGTVSGAMWLRTVTADAFSTSATYAVGDTVVYSNAFYRCKTAVTEAGAWSAAKWEAVEKIAEISIDTPAFVASGT